MPSLASRRSAHHLTPIQTSFNDQRSFLKPQSNPAPSPIISDIIPENNVKETDEPLSPTTPLKPQKSRSSIFDLFSRPNVERGRTLRESLPPSTLPPPQPDKPSRGPTRQPSTLKKTPPPLQPPPSDVFSTDRKGSLQSVVTHKSLRFSKKKIDPDVTLTSVAWEPPPLFQAYPQAVKHTVLDAPSSPQGLAKQSQRHNQNGHVQDAPKEKRSFGDGLFRRKKHVRLHSIARSHQRASSWHKPREWSPRIFVLVTAGYVLQYTADGPSDRRPERILKLGPNSAAFASDIIEGEHWVLQVLETANADELSGLSGQKRVLSRMALPVVDSKRFTTSMILVFNTPVEMDSWMCAIRREIDKAAGRSPISPDEPGNGTLSHRASTIKREPSPHSNPATSPTKSSLNSSTLIGSRSPSSTAGIATSPDFSTSYSNRPHLQSPQPQENYRLSVLSTQSSEIENTIGPAFRSPGFFERQASPRVFEFPISPTTKVTHSDNQPSFRTMNFSLPSNNTYTDQRSSVKSMSSVSSIPVAETGMKEHNHPYLYNPSTIAEEPRDSQENKGTFLHVDSCLSTPIPPEIDVSPVSPISSPRSNSTTTRETSQETISHDDSPNSLKEERIITTTSSVSLRPLPFRNFSAPLENTQTTPSPRSQKRASVFSKPIPVVPQTASGTAQNGITASAPSSRRTSRRGPPLILNLPPRTAQGSAPASLATSPKAITNGSDENTLRRPPSIQIRSDRAPFLSADNGTVADGVKPNVIPENKRLSTQVPIVRPPIIKQGTRSRRSTPRISLPPPQNPPPNIPLPPPPVPTVQG